MARSRRRRRDRDFPDQRLDDSGDAAFPGVARLASFGHANRKLAGVLESVRGLRHLLAIADATSAKLVSDFTDVAGGPNYMIEASEGTTEMPSLVAVMELQAALRRISEAAGARVEELLAGGESGPLKVELELFQDPEPEVGARDWSPRAVPKAVSEKGGTRA